MTIKRQQTTVRRKQIVNAFRTILVNHGSESLTVRAIANVVGITEGTIYRHFKSKRDILLSVIDDCAEEAIEDFTKAIAEDELSLDKLDSIIREHILAVDKRGLLPLQTVAQLVTADDKELSERISRNTDRVTGVLRDLLSLAVKSGQVREDIDLSGSALLLSAIMNDLATRRLLSNHNDYFEEKYKPMWRVFRDAIAKR